VPGASPSAYGPGIAIKAAVVAGLRQQTEIIMAQIGSFNRGEDGVFTGTIKTLSLNVKARLVPADTSPSVPMTMRHRLPGSLALRVLKDDLAHAHRPMRLRPG